MIVFNWSIIWYNILKYDVILEGYKQGLNIKLEPPMPNVIPT